VYYEVRTKTTYQRRVYTDVAIKRFSDFTNLATSVRRSFPREILPEPPKKKVWGANDRAFVQRRRLELENYLIALLNFGSPGNAVRICEDLRAFLPEQAFIGVEKKSQTAGFVTFDVHELNRFNQKTSGQLLSISPSLQLLTITPRGSGSADGKDKLILKISDIASAVDVEGSSTRVALFYYDPPLGTIATTPVVSPIIPIPTSNGNNNSNGMMLGTSPSSAGGLTSTSLQPALAGTLANQSSTTAVGSSSATSSTAASTLMPKTAVTSSTTAIGASSVAAAAAIKPRKKMFEFASLDDRQRFSRLYRSLEPDRGPSRSPRSRRGTGVMTPQFANVSVWCTSWNLAKEPPPDDLNGWIPLCGGGHGIICIGVQECHMTLAAFQIMFEKQLGPG
jgi:hypothetical protein